LALLNLASAASEVTAAAAPHSLQSSCSASTCAALGWKARLATPTAGPAPAPALPTVCAARELGAGTGLCSGPLSWADAAAFCDAVGGRLCEADELHRLDPGTAGG
jgi:hypothetical protein